MRVSFHASWAAWAVRALPATLALALALGMILCPSSFADAEQPPLRITRIIGGGGGRGDGERVAATVGDEQRTLHVGDPVALGTRILTERGQEIELSSRDASRIIVTENSDVEAETHPQSDQALFLRSGKIAGSISKASVPAPGPPGSPGSSGGSSGERYRKPKFRFLLRTRAAVMGVRGTQFVVDASAENGTSSFHVLEGVVDVAKTLDDLLTDSFVVVHAGQFVDFLFTGLESATREARKATVAMSNTVSEGMGKVTSAAPFNVPAFLANLNRALPDEFHIPFLMGEDPRYRSEFAWFHLSSFEIYASSYYSYVNVPGSERSLGFGLSWNPTFHLVSDKLDIRGHVGLPKLFQDGGSPWDHLELKVLATAILKGLYFAEAGPAYQLVHPNQGSFGINVNGGMWFGDSRLFHILDRIFFGVTWVANAFPKASSPSERVDKWEYRFGAGFTIF